MSEDDWLLIKYKIKSTKHFDPVSLVFTLFPVSCYLLFIPRPGCDWTIKPLGMAQTGDRSGHSSSGLYNQTLVKPSRTRWALACYVPGFMADCVPKTIPR